MRRHRRALTVSLALAVSSGTALVGLPAVSADAAPASFTLRVGVISNVTGKVGGLEGWGVKQGIWQKELKPLGVTKIDWSTYPNGPNLDAALTGGSLDIGILGDTPAVDAKAQGAPTKLFAIEENGLDTWIFGKKNGPKTLQGLVGQTVAVPEGSYIWRALVGILSDNHLQNKVKVVNQVSVPIGIAELEKGSIDAFAELPDQALVNGGFPVIAKASKGYPQLLGTTVNIITKSADSAHPGLVAAWNKARQVTLANAKAHASAYYAWAAAVGGDSVSLTKQVENLKIDTTQPLEPSAVKRLEAVSRFLFEQKVIEVPVSVPSWETRS